MFARFLDFNLAKLDGAKFIPTTGGSSLAGELLAGGFNHKLDIGMRRRAMGAYLERAGFRELHFPGDPFVPFIPETDVGLAALVFRLDLVAMQFSGVGGQRQVPFGVGAYRFDDFRRRHRLEIGAGNFKCSGVFRRLLRRKRNNQTVGGLGELEPAFVAEKFHLLNAVACFAGRLREGSDGQLTVLGPAQREGVQRLALGGEANVLGRVLEVFFETAALGLDRPFA